MIYNQGGAHWTPAGWRRVAARGARDLPDPTTYVARADNPGPYGETLRPEALGRAVRHDCDDQTRLAFEVGNDVVTGVSGP
jgi:hypothetical protein